MKVINLRKGDKLMYVKDEHMSGAHYKGQVDTVHCVDAACVAIQGGAIGIPMGGITENYKYIREDGSLEDITVGMGQIEFIARARHLGWVCFQMGAGLPYNVEPTAEQITSLEKGVIFALCKPNATPEDNHEYWMNYKQSQGWVYGETLDWEKKTHPSIVPFEQLPQVEKDKDTMDLTMTKEFEKLWGKIFE